MYISLDFIRSLNLYYVDFYLWVILCFCLLLFGVLFEKKEEDDEEKEMKKKKKEQIKKINKSKNSINSYWTIAQIFLSITLSRNRQRNRVCMTPSVGLALRH